MDNKSSINQKKAKQIMDLKIFEKIYNSKCNDINDCTHLLRIGYSLKYFDLLCSDNNYLIFIDFCSNSYPQCLEDYIHLICYHSDNESLNKIQNYLHKNHKINICLNINKCQETQRHYISNRNRMDKKEKNNDDFYINLFDTMHSYIYHLQSLGLRVPINDNDDDDNKDANDNYLECIDLRIGEIQKIIENKRKQITNLNMERLDNINNSKFNIMVNQNQVNDNNDVQKTDTENGPKKKKIQKETHLLMI